MYYLIHRFAQLMVKCEKGQTFCALAIVEVPLEQAGFSPFEFKQNGGGFQNSAYRSAMFSKFKVTYRTYYI